MLKMARQHCHQAKQNNNATGRRNNGGTKGKQGGGAAGKANKEKGLRDVKQCLLGHWYVFLFSFHYFITNELFSSINKYY
jgi:hypothetical protein